MSGGLLDSGFGPVGTALARGTAVWSAPRGAAPGPVIAAFADVMDDPDGVGLVVQLESPRDEVTTAWVQVLDARRTPIGGRPPFVDDAGAFALMVPVIDGAASLFVAWGALTDPPEAAHLVVTFLADGLPVGHTAFDVAPQRRDRLALDAWVRPFVQMAMAVVGVRDAPDAQARAAIRQRLEGLFTLTDDEWVQIDRILDDRVPSTQRMAVSLGCRFPELDIEELFYALIGVAAEDGTVRPDRVDVLASIARHMQVPDPTWRRWAHRRGVDLPEPGQPPSPAAPPRREVAKTLGRRLVPSVILRLDPEGQDRRNPAATWSMLGGVAVMVLMFAGFLGALTPLSAIPALVLLPAELLLALGSLLLGIFAWRRAGQLDGAGRGAAITGVSLAAVYLMIVAVVVTAACLGLGTTALLEQVYDL